MICLPFPNVFVRIFTSYGKDYIVSMNAAGTVTSSNSWDDNSLWLIAIETKFIGQREVALVSFQNYASRNYLNITNDGTNCSSSTPMLYEAWGTFGCCRIFPYGA